MKMSSSLTIEQDCNGRRYNFYVNFLYQCYDRSCPKSNFEGFMLHEKKAEISAESKSSNR